MPAFMPHIVVKAALQALAKIGTGHHNTTTSG